MLREFLHSKWQYWSNSCANCNNNFDILQKIKNTLRNVEGIFAQQVAILE